MARDEKRNRVGRTCASDGSHGSRGTQRSGNLTVRARLPVRDPAQLLPDAPLERCGPDVERKIGMRTTALEVRHQCAHGPAERSVAPADLGPRVFRAKIRFERSITVSEHHAAHARVGGSHEQASERRGGDRVVDSCAMSPAPIRGRRHAHLRVGVFVEAAARPVAGLVECGSHPFTSLERGFEPSEPARLGVGARRDTQQACERPLQAEGIETDPRRKRAERVPVARCCTNDVTRQPNLRQWRAGQGRFRRMAAPARPETGPFGALRVVKEHHCGATRLAARARGTTVHARRADRIDKTAVIRRVSPQHRRPAPGVSQRHRDEDRPVALRGSIRTLREKSAALRLPVVRKSAPLLRRHPLLVESEPCGGLWRASPWSSPS
jgi:hypothetical protein